jgi:putative hydrolase of the HAD superfamily
MLGTVRRARDGGVRTALVSNHWGIDYPKRWDIEDLFDVIVLSAAVGMRKPDTDIFTSTAERLGVKPPECVFVDDLEENVEGARAAGMRAILHRDARSTIPKLEELLGVDLGAAELTA